MHAAAPALRCTACGTTLTDDGAYHLSCCDDGLLEGRYPRRLVVDSSREGLWRFHEWLPVAAPGDDAVGGSTFPAPELGAAIGARDLWLSVNGWWPERGANCPTCSFKDLEASPTLRRLAECGAPGVVVATAGNTGRAFAHLGGLAGFPVCVIVGEPHVERIWRPGVPHAATTRIVGITGGDYGDATAVAREVAPGIGWQLEGGVRNVARRDGIGTLLLDAVVEMGRLPDHYVQAVGGGPGPIGVHEMARRLLADGRWGERLPRFHLAQNVEHQPVNRAWRAGRDHLLPEDFPPGPVDTYADVLVNRAPAYALRGGLHDVLTATAGQTYAVPREDAVECRRLVADVVGIDVLEPAAVAVAGLRAALADGEIDPGDRVLLAITGAGVEHLSRTTTIHPPTDVTMTSIAEAAEVVRDLLVGR